MEKGRKEKKRKKKRTEEGSRDRKIKESRVNTMERGE